MKTTVGILTVRGTINNCNTANGCIYHLCVSSTIKLTNYSIIFFETFTYYCGRSNTKRDIIFSQPNCSIHWCYCRKVYMLRKEALPTWRHNGAYWGFSRGNCRWNMNVYIVNIEYLVYRKYQIRTRKFSIVIIYHIKCKDLWLTINY